MKRKIRSLIKILFVSLGCLFLLGSFYEAVQALSEEIWIIPETISSGLAHACGILANGEAILASR